MIRPAGITAVDVESVFSRRVLAAMLFAVLVHAWLLFGLEGAQPVAVEAETDGEAGIEISLSFAPLAPPESGPLAEALPEIVPEPHPAPEPEPAPRPVSRLTVSPPVASGTASAEAESTVLREQAQTADTAARVEVANPRRHANAKPVYPELARRRGQEGTVLLEVNVDSSGNPLSVAIAQGSGHRLLDEAAVRAVEKWLFNPARQDGVAVPGQVRVPVVFRLTD